MVPDTDVKIEVHINETLNRIKLDIDLKTAFVFLVTNESNYFFILR